MHVYVLLMVLVLGACSQGRPASQPPETPEGAPPPVVGEPHGPDLSSPGSTVRAFIDAATSGDVDVLSLCFSIRSDKEFLPILEKSVGDDDLEQIRSMFMGASIVETTEGPDGVTAIVKVKLQWDGRPFEEIHVHREGSAWKIKGF